MHRVLDAAFVTLVLIGIILIGYGVALDEDRLSHDACLRKAWLDTSRGC